MTHQYSYFCFDGTLESIRSTIEKSLGVQLSERESSYWGGTYFQFRDAVAGFRLKVHRNIDHQGEWILSEFQGSQILCSIDGPVETASTYFEKLVGAGGHLLASRTREIEHE